MAEQVKHQAEGAPEPVGWEWRWRKTSPYAKTLGIAWHFERGQPNVDGSEDKHVEVHAVYAAPIIPAGWRGVIEGLREKWRERRRNAQLFEKAHEHLKAGISIEALDEAVAALAALEEKT